MLTFARSSFERAARSNVRVIPLRDGPAMDSYLPEAELPRGLVSVRTIDDSPSHQAEVVICDLVRTEKPGFLIEDERLAVMTTRARVLTIIEMMPTPRTTKVAT